MEIIEVILRAFGKLLETEGGRFLEFLETEGAGLWRVLEISALLHWAWMYWQYTLGAVAVAVGIAVHASSNTAKKE